MKIYSKIDNRLLHIVYNNSGKEREDISPNNEFLQVAALNLSKGKTFRAHKHLPNPRQTDLTQEAWIVVCGKVKAFLFDINNTLLETVILNAGDLSITFYGGHTYEILEDNTFVYEFKTGPYLGQDKEFI